MEEPKITLIVPREHVKRVKTALEDHKCLDRQRKITAVIPEEQGDTDISPRMRIPTLIPFQSRAQDEAYETRSFDIAREVFITLALGDLERKIVVEKVTLPSTSPNCASSTQKGPFKALENALNDLPDGFLETLQIATADLVSAFPKTYSIYKPMLLLPAHTFASQPWRKLLSAYPTSSQELHPVWQKVAASAGCTHMAINSGIPPTKTPTTDHTFSDPIQTNTEENVLRAPLNITPIYGSFGPHPTPTLQSCPSPSDFVSAFWVSTTQNGIHQIWAPLYTMFSRGNIREKTRILHLPSVQAAVSADAGCAALDLYAGIGYFSFCYRKAGVKKVLCWELNPWSIEGLRRGAERNGWTTFTFPHVPGAESSGESSLSSSPGAASIERFITQLDEAQRRELQAADFLIFPSSNATAESTLAALRSCMPSLVPPVRHVNLGFLPSSQLSWRTAVRVVDRRLGGWIHAHENVGVEDISTRESEVVQEMLQSALELEKEIEEGGSRGSCGAGGKPKREVVCEHVERVKTYAPGVLHVVFDISVSGVEESKALSSIGV